ncbi:MAG: Stk1 family PASTA domain-containing Ser/Thr kinase [Clostridia bacterium]|nr:Stk1 family PASTA domain-containing Ser/Thr kinase [Clostridia bacterium]MBQ7312663.1 Stk1 family PASTA domain-containing Ser/Thr kinase [Clostridia bacterium]
MMELYEKYVGLVFDNRYRVERIVGIGGMAVVFKATDLLMRRTVAIKILKDEISADEQAVQRFKHEYRAVAMLSHQNIVNIHDASVRDNIKYIVMEYVEGITLKNYMQHREVLNLREIISYTTQILRALDHAHKKGIIHRDIKPQNIMLLKNGVIKVMDFGIAKIPNAETVTMTDKAIGTVYYISPEQVNGSPTDARSDLYALGVMLYEMATGSLPFSAETPVSVALMQVNDTATPPREINPHIPVGLEQIITRAMEKDPDARYQSAEEMLEHLLKLRENPKIIFKENKAAKNKQKKQKNADTAASKPKHKTSRSMFPIIMGVTLAFLVVAGVAGYYMLDRLFLNGSMNDYEELRIPNFVGSAYTEELAEWFESSEYYTDPVITYVYSDTVEKGKIMEQEPLAEEKRKVLPGKQECEVQLTVSQGARTITLEDYSVRDYREVRTELRDLGLNVKEERVTDSILLTGYVVRTEPGVGTVLHEDDTVTIYISNGSDTVTVSVPDFKGLSEARALITLMEHDLNVGDVTYEKNWQTAGTVIGQSVDAWSSVPKYSEISFTVSGGPSYAGDGKTIPTEDDMKWTPVETPEPVVTPEPDNTWDDGNGSSDWTDDTNDDNSGWTDDSAGTVWEDNTGEDSGSTDDSWMDDTSGGTEEDNTSDDDNWWDLGWDWIRP